MRQRGIIILIALAIAAFIVASVLYAAGNSLTASEKTAGWKLLFDGKTLDGWKATGDPKGWKVENGEIANLANGGGMLASTGQYGDFILSIDVKYEKGANSGIFFRWANLDDPVQRGIEMQILDSYGKQKPDKHDFGAIYDCLAPTKIACKPAGEWNNVVLACRGNRIFIDVNHKRVLFMNLDRWDTAHRNPDGSDNKFRTAYKEMPRKGYIGFQDHGHKVWFRNIKIKPLNS
jgi:hypothetical protein